MNRLFIFLIILLWILLCSPSSNIEAQWSNDPAVNTPVCLVKGGQSLPQIVSDGMCGAIICWEDFRLAGAWGPSDVYAQRVDAEGYLRWPEGGVPVSIAPGSQIEPKMVSDGSGGAIIVWQDTRNDEGDIYAQRVKRTGEIVWQEGGVPVCRAPGVQGFSPLTHQSIAADGRGGAFISWIDNLWDSNSDIYAQHVDANGLMQWGENGVAICTARNAQDQPAVVGDGEDGAIIVWRDVRNEDFSNGKVMSDDEDERYLNYDLYAQRVGSNSVVQWEPDGVPISIAPEAQGYAVVLEDDHGGAIIAWSDYRSRTNLDIYAQRVDGAGVMQWEENGVAVCAADFDQNWPEIVKDDGGGVIICWYDERGERRVFDLYSQKVNLGGEVSWVEDGVTLCTAPTRQWFHKMTTDGSGGAIVAWEENIVDINIYTQRINGNGVIQWTEDGVAVCTASDLQVEPTIITDGNGGAITTWWDGRDGESDIYAQQVSIEGLLGEASLGVKGDVDNNKGINVLDVLRCVNIMIEIGTPPSPQELYRADVDYSGEVNITDIVGIVNLILNP